MHHPVRIAPPIMPMAIAVSTPVSILIGQIDPTSTFFEFRDFHCNEVYVSRLVGFLQYRWDELRGFAMASGPDLSEGKEKFATTTPLRARKIRT